MIHFSFTVKPKGAKMSTRHQIGSLKPFGLRIPDEIKGWAMEQAQKERMSLNSWLLRLLDEKREAQHAKAA